MKSGVIFETLDLWILTRLQRAISKATKSFSEYEYCDARVAIEDFFWNDFCDNYLEMVKGRAYDEKGENPKGQLSAAHAIHHCLDGILRLFAPFVPHITEELYSTIFEEKIAKIKSIHSRGNWPDAKLYPVDEAAEKSGIAGVSILNAVRKLKSEQNLSMKVPINVLYVNQVSEKQENVKEIEYDLKSVTNALDIKWLGKTDISKDLPNTLTEDQQFTVGAEFGEKVNVA